MRSQRSRRRFLALDRIEDLVAAPDKLGSIGDLFRLANVRMYLEFAPVKVKKRTLNKLVGGVLTLGAAEPPILLYEGPTSRA